jgi:predicted nucleic acid-binding protein
LRVLLDTNVVSEIRRAAPSPLVVERVKQIQPHDTYLSVITSANWFTASKRMAAGKKRRELEGWLTSLQQVYASRILSVDLETTHTWGEVTALSESKGRPLPAQDGLIAATALRHGLHLMTRNVTDFQATGVMLINPWEP